MSAALDSLGLRAAALRAPELVVGARDLARRHAPASALPTPEGVDAVLLLGAGEGEVAARLVAALVEPLLPVPLVRATGFAAPAFASARTLVLAMSWAGEHAEVLEASEALPAGVPLVALASGGSLAEATTKRLHGVVVPLPEVPVGRAATGALVAAALTVLESAGLLPGAAQWLSQAAEQLARRRDMATEAEPFGPFGKLARRLAGTIPLVQGAGPLGGAAAAAWAARVRLDTKALAWWSALPNLAHQEVAAFGQHGDITRQLVSLVQLRHGYEHPSLTVRFGAVDEWLAEVVAGIHTVRATGEGAVAQALDLVLQGDLVALAMAAEAGLDPGPVGVEL